MIRCKPGVDFDRVHPVMFAALIAAESIYSSHGVSECWITSANDSEHMEGSLHYAGLAIDLRSKNIPRETREAVFSALARRLRHLDIIWEYPDREREHFHLEYDS